jgi:hypothetical protein
MDVNVDAIDEAVLALFQLTLHEGNRAWKGFDWGVLNRLYQKGLIADPVGREKSIWMTEQGLEASRRAFEGLFVTPASEGR